MSRPMTECALFAPDVPLTEGSPYGDALAEALGLQLPLPEFSHEQFMRERKHDGWLAWQTTRPLRLPGEPKRRQPKVPAPRSGGQAPSRGRLTT